MKENPYQAPCSYLESPARPSRSQAAAWGANRGAMVGAASGVALFSTLYVIEIVIKGKLSQYPIFWFLVDTTVYCLVLSVVGALIGALVCGLLRIKARNS